MSSPPTLLRPVPQLTLLLIVACAFFAQAAFCAPVIKPGDVVAACGDSLTDQKEYSVFIEDYLLMCQSVAGVKTLQCGWGGSTASHLVDRVVINKQEFETQFITHYLFNQGGLLTAVPTKSSALKMIDAGYREVHAGLLENCQKAVKPVTHTIKIEELSGGR